MTGVVVILVGVVEDASSPVRPDFHRDRLLARVVVAHRQLQAVPIIQLLDCAKSLERKRIDDVRRVVRVAANQVCPYAAQCADGVVSVIDVFVKCIHQ